MPFSALHFVVPKSFEARLADIGRQRVGADYPYWLGGRYNWSAQSYLVLREHRERLSIGVEPMPGVMNFAHCMAWRALGQRRGEYRISVRADYPALFDVDFEILQNPAAPLARRQAYLPYWPVPGIIPRDAGRGPALRTVAYAGRIGGRNLADPLRAGRGGGALGSLDFAVIAPDRWHDMSQIDLLIAIRSFDRRTHDNKPPSKLFNAWLAGIPLIGGWDSAFSSVGRPGVDYLRVESEAELETAVARLCEDPDYHRGVVDAGRARRVEVSHDAAASAWLKLLEGLVAADFERWRGGGGEKRRPRVRRSLDVGRALLSRAKSTLVAR